jgi:hypothetical protein
MSIDQRFTSLRGSSAALIALLACWSPSVSDAGRAFVSAPVADSRPLMPGVWGGDHIRMVIGRESTRLEYDCAAGTIDQPIGLDASGQFTVKGSYAPEHHGPRRDGETAARRAVYVGRVTGATMTLTVTLEAGGQRVGRFTLKRGNDPLLMKCR